jgi:hypothetical protein
MEEHLDQDEIINLYKQGHGAPFIALKLNISNHYIYKAIKAAGIPIRTHREKSLKYTIDQTTFDDIDTEPKAYWLGFLAADGYQSKGYLGCSLSLKDKEHLEKLRVFLNSTHPVKTYTQTIGFAAGTQYARLLIACPDLCVALTKHGVVERKTHTLKFPILPLPLRKHFIRGYLDGDGCWAKSYKSASGFTMKICGTQSFLKQIAIELQLSTQRVHKHKSIFCLEKSGKDVLRIMNILYTDATIYLERKRERWFVAQSLLAAKLIEKPRELLGSPERVISSQALESPREGSTTISKESRVK